MFLDGWGREWDSQALQVAHSAVSGLDVHGASRYRFEEGPLNLSG